MSYCAVLGLRECDDLAFIDTWSHCNPYCSPALMPYAVTIKLVDEGREAVRMTSVASSPPPRIGTLPSVVLGLTSNSAAGFLSIFSLSIPTL